MMSSMFLGSRMVLAGRPVTITAVWETACCIRVGFRDDDGHVDETMDTILLLKERRHG